MIIINLIIIIYWVNIDFLMVKFSRKMKFWRMLKMFKSLKYIGVGFIFIFLVFPNDIEFLWVFRIESNFHEFFGIISKRYLHIAYDFLHSTFWWVQYRG